MTILLNLKKTIMATRIQKTWRSIKLDKEFLFERLEALYNRLGNFDFTDIKHCNDLESVSTSKRTSFSHDLEGIDGDDIPYIDITESQDGKNRKKSIFTSAISLWYNVLDKTDFFDGACKKYVYSGSSIYWDEWIKDLLERLENGDIVYLWGHSGGYKRLFPLVDTKKIQEFNNAWLEYNNSTDAEYDSDESLDIIDTSIDDINTSMSKIKLNPEAEPFVPRISKKRNAEDVIMELDNKIQRHINMQNIPVYYSRSIE